MTKSTPDPEWLRQFNPTTSDDLIDHIQQIKVDLQEGKISTAEARRRLAHTQRALAAVRKRIRGGS